MANPFIHWIEAKGPYAPLLFAAVFIAASFLMIWRLEAMNKKGFEGTVLGTLVMPYCSGLGNLIFAILIGRDPHGNGADVMVNSLVNNITNMTLVLGLPAVVWGIHVLPKTKAKARAKTAPATAAAAKVNFKKAEVKLKASAKPSKKSGAAKTHELNRLSLLLTLLAVLFFTGAVWVLGHKGRLTFDDGLILIGLFLFWQCFHVFEVLKTNVRDGKSLISFMLLVDFAILAVGAYGIYVSTDWLVNWLSGIKSGFISAKHMGWLTGWLMVLPNALLAGYYAWRGKPETVYASQVGDAHVSIPLCIGIYCLYHTMALPPFFQASMILLLAATLVHFVFVAVFGRLPRIAGLGLIVAYGIFLWKGLIG